MLSPARRTRFATLLDALTLHEADERLAIAYVASDRDPVHVTRRQFRQEVLAHAAGLQRLGLGRGDLVLVAHTQNLESIYAFWGALLAGAIPAMFPTLTEKLDPVVYMAGMAELVRLSQVSAVLTTSDFAPTLARQLDCPVLDSEALARAVDGAGPVVAFEAPAPDPDSVAFLQHSSGTTGLQKGVALSHRAVLNQIAAYGQAIALQADDVIVSWLPLYHDMGLIAGFLMPLVQGVPLVLMSPFDWVSRPALLLQAIHHYGGTLCWLPNFAYNHCARRIRPGDSQGLSAASMRLFVNCSEPVYAESHRLFLERFAAHGVRPEMLAVSYAMAENVFAVTQTPPGRPPVHDIVDRRTLEESRQARAVPPAHPRASVQVSCGLPIAGTAVRVLTDDGRSLPDRHVGELAIRSDYMLSGYYRRPDLNPFDNGWYRTGDMGYLAEGEVYIVGRAKDLIINAGKNIYPQDIEAIVNEVPGVYPGRAVAFGVPDAREGTELIAVVAEVRDPATLADGRARAALVRAVRQAVAAQSTVSAAYVEPVGRGWLLKTSSGKIARAANRQKWLNGRS